jgi:hypothetical protein
MMMMNPAPQASPTAFNGRVYQGMPGKTPANTPVFPRVEFPPPKGPSTGGGGVCVGKGDRRK